MKATVWLLLRRPPRPSFKKLPNGPKAFMGDDDDDDEDDDDDDDEDDDDEDMKNS
jgi:hypothetical protein